MEQTLQGLSALGCVNGYGAFGTRALRLRRRSISAPVHFLVLIACMLGRECAEHLNVPQVTSSA